MNLKEKIKEKKAQFQSSASEKNQEVMKHAITELQDSGILDKASGKGDKAPDFTVENSAGKSINLKETLSKGPVVLVFTESDGDHFAIILIFTRWLPMVCSRKAATSMSCRRSRPGISKGSRTWLNTSSATHFRSPRYTTQRRPK